jgi:hypothetical protein
MPLHILIIHPRAEVAGLIKKTIRTVLSGHIGTLHHCTNLNEGFRQILSIQPSIVLCDTLYREDLAKLLFDDPAIITMIAPFVIITIDKPRYDDLISFNINIDRIIQLAFHQSLLPTSPHAPAINNMTEIPHIPPQQTDTVELSDSNRKVSY